jgi:hypothetical protein
VDSGALWLASRGTNFLAGVAFFFEPFLNLPRPINSGGIVFSRSRLKWGLLVCLIILAETNIFIFQPDSTLALWVKDTLFFAETGSAAGAIAFCLALIATA